MTERRREILKWIYSGDFEERHKYVAAERAQGSGEWFLRSENYRQWTGSRTSEVLCCLGMRKFLLKCVH